MAVNNNISSAFRGAAGLTKDYYEALVVSSMIPYQQNLRRAEARKDTLEVQKAVYNDLDSKMSALYDAVDALRKPETGSTETSVFDTKKATSGDSAYFTATATSDAVNASYDVHVTQMATAHEVWGSAKASGYAIDLSGFGGSSTFTLQVGGDAANQIDVTINDGDSLSDIASAINSRVTALTDDETIDSENGLQATVVDGRLILKSSSTGVDYELSVVSDADNVLGELGLTGGTDADASGFNDATENRAQNALFDVNGITGISRNSNTDISDVIEGVTISLKKAHEEATDKTSLTVTADDSAVSSTISGFVSKFNDLMKWLKNKTTTQETSPGVYSRGSLSDNFGIKSLRSSLVQTAFATWSGAPTGSTYNRLDQIGISLGDNLVASLDSGELSTAMSTDYENVVDLLDHVMDSLEEKLNPYTEGSETLIDQMKASADNALELQSTKVESITKTNARREEVLRDQIARQFAAISSYNDQGRYLTMTMFNQFG